MLNAITMKNPIILFFTIFYASNNIFTQLFFIGWLVLFYFRSMTLNIFQNSIKNPFVKILINGFFISPNLTPKSNSSIFILNNIILTLIMKILSLKNFSHLLCTLLCTYSGSMHLEKLSNKLPKFNKNTHQKIINICFLKLKIENLVLLNFYVHYFPLFSLTEHSILLNTFVKNQILN